MKYSGITEHNKAAFDAIVPRVNEAIESGKIAIPAGGTQLYKHSLGFDDVGEGEATIRIDVLMLTNTVLTPTGTTAFDNYKKQIIAILDSANNGKALYFFLDSNEQWNIRQQDDYYKDLMDYTLGNFINDVVTPL